MPLWSSTCASLDLWTGVLQTCQLHSSLLLLIDINILFADPSREEDAAREAPFPFTTI
jgi:hypothetical protein